MKKIAAITKRYSIENKEYNHERSWLEDKIQQCQQDLEELEFPSWVKGMIEPIAKELGKYIGPNSAWSYEIFGPFGLGARTSIHFKINEKDVKSITFEPGDLSEGELRIVDFRHPTNKYSKDSIGEMNGFNYPLIDIPNGADFEWLSQYVIGDEN